MENWDKYFHDTPEYKQDTSEPLYKKFFTGTKNLKTNFNDNFYIGRLKNKFEMIFILIKFYLHIILYLKI